MFIVQERLEANPINLFQMKNSLEKSSFFQIYIFTSLREKEEIPCYKVSLFLVKISKEFDFNNFEYIHRFSFEKSLKWNEDTFKLFVNPNVSKVIINANPLIEKQIKAELRKT